MDPVAVITLAIALAEKFVTLMRIARKKVLGRQRPSPDAQQDLSWLRDCLLYLKSATALGVSSQALETLLEELVSSVQHAKKLLKPPYTKKLASQDILGLFMSKFKSQVDSALLEVLKNDNIQPMVSKEVNMIKDIIVQKLSEQEVITVITGIIQKEAVSNPMLNEALSFVRNTVYPTEAFQMLIDNLLAFEHHDHFLPILQTPEAEKDVLEEAAKAGIPMKALAGTNKLEEEKKTREGALDIEKQVERSTKFVNYGLSDNPNSMLSVVAEDGEGVLHVSKCYGNQWKVIHQGLSMDVRTVRGEKQMQLSAELGCFYYEVKLVQMIELGYSTGTGLAGVGVGLAHRVKSKKVAGWYTKSYGYDGRVGHTYCESRVCDFEIGSLVAGDTLGIGLLTQHGRSPSVFLTKNGVFEGFKSDSRLAQYSCQLYPVISLASFHVEVLVNFYGPFLLPSMSDLVAAAAARNHI